MNLTQIRELLCSVASKHDCYLDVGTIERETTYLNIDFHYKAIIYPMVDDRICFDEYLEVKIYRDKIRFSGGKSNVFHARLSQIKKVFKGLYEVLI